jgi:uncharacterized membrane protein YoaT (DUF817 family)
MPVSTALSIRENPLADRTSSHFMTKITHTLSRRPEKWSSWSLLIIMTFTIVANLKHIKERIHVPA